MYVICRLVQHQFAGSFFIVGLDAYKVRAAGQRAHVDGALVSEETVLVNHFTVQRKDAHFGLVNRVAVERERNVRGGGVGEQHQVAGSGRFVSRSSSPFSGRCCGP